MLRLSWRISNVLGSLSMIKLRIPFEVSACRLIVKSVDKKLGFVFQNHTLSLLKIDFGLFKQMIRLTCSKLIVAVAGRIVVCLPKIANDLGYDYATTYTIKSIWMVIEPASAQCPH